MYYLKYLFYHKLKKARKKWDVIGDAVVAVKAVAAEYVLTDARILAVDLVQVPAKDIAKAVVKGHVVAVAPVIHINSYAS